LTKKSGVCFADTCRASALFLPVLSATLVNVHLINDPVSITALVNVHLINDPVSFTALVNVHLIKDKVDDRDL